MAEFKLKKGQKVYHIREFSSVMELARRKLIAPDDPIFVPAVGRWVYAKSIQELRPILPEPDTLADEEFELPLEFVEPLAEDIGGLTVEMDMDSMGIGVSAMERRLEPISGGRTRDVLSRPASSPGISVRPPSSPGLHIPSAPSADDWDDRPTEAGIRPRQGAGTASLHDVRGSGQRPAPRDSLWGPDPLRIVEPRTGEFDPLRPAGVVRPSGGAGEPPRGPGQAGGPGPSRGLGVMGGNGRGPASGDFGRGPTSGDFGRGPASGDFGRGPASGDFGRGPASGDFGRGPNSGDPHLRGPASQADYGRSGLERGDVRGSEPRLEPIRTTDPGRETGRGNGRGPELRLPPDLSRALEDRPTEELDRGWNGSRRGDEGTDPRRTNPLAGPELQSWIHGAPRARGAEPQGADPWDERVTGGNGSSSARPAGSSRQASPVSFQSWMEEQSRRSGKPPAVELTPLGLPTREKEEPKKRVSWLRIGLLLALSLIAFSAFTFWVRSTANMEFQSLDATPPAAGLQSVGETDPELEGEGVEPISTGEAAATGRPRPVVAAGEEARLRELIRPQTSGMRTFDQAQDELFSELLNLRVSVADVKLEPVLGDRTKSVRTSEADLSVRLKEGKFTTDQQSGLVGLVAGKYVKRNKLILRYLVLQIERPGEEPLIRRVSGELAGEFFSRSQDFQQFLLAAQAGTEVPL